MSNGLVYAILFLGGSSTNGRMEDLCNNENSQKISLLDP
jgi:hypothetical protein